jgi:hypothetical protein
MLARKLAILALVAAPAALAAQGRGMGGMGGRRGGGREGMSSGGSRVAPKFPVAKDLEKLNPAALLIDKRKKLSLSDSQIALLKALELKIYERNGDLMAQYDSVRKEYRPPSSSSGDDKGQAESMAQVKLMTSLLDQLVDRRRTDVQESLTLVTDEHKKTAAELLDKQDKEFLEQIPSGTGRPSSDGRKGRPGDR